MGILDIFKKKKAEESSMEGYYSKYLGDKSEYSKQTDQTIKSTDFSSSSLSAKHDMFSSQQQDKISLIESKIENLRIYLEMINSKLDRLETLLRAKGLI